MEKISPKKFTLTEAPDHVLVHDLSGSPIMNKKILGAIAAAIIIAGGITGWALAGSAQKQSGSMATSTNGETSGDLKPGKVVGSNDTTAFPDQAEGMLRDGGLDGEGTHHLEREGGPSKTAYLTSSILNLSDFVDKKVRVWGETHAAKKAGWLMDVGKVEIIN